MATSANPHERFLATEAQLTQGGHRQLVDREALQAGLQGTPREQIRALGALHRLNLLTADHLLLALKGSHPNLRIRALELALSCEEIPLVPHLHDEDPLVVATAAWALGERESEATHSDAVPILCELVRSHEDARVREAAVAALGSIGDPKALDTVIAATRDKVSVRRRAAVALAAFDDLLADFALAALRNDRDWQVRQIAEDLNNPNS